MKTAAIYARVSSINDRQNIYRQVTDLQSYASKRDYNIVEVFTEHISGAKKNAEVETLCECLNFCIKNKIATLLKRGYSVRNVAKLTKVSNSTVQRVKKEFAL